MPRITPILLLLVCFTTLAKGNNNAKPPLNVIVVLVDDLGWMDLSVQGSDFYKTPHIDRLAKNGDDTFIQFNRSNVANYDYSFSGMKTSFLYALQNRVKEAPDFIEKYKAELVRDMKLMGCTKISDLNRNNLRFRK